jgi:putative holliday junction resolvase
MNTTCDRAGARVHARGWAARPQAARAARPGTTCDRSPATTASALPSVRSFLAFDFGARRVGVASGNTLTRTATPLRTVAAEGVARFEAIARLIAQWQPQALVVGVPLHPDGASHENTLRAQRFGRQLRGRFGLPVHEVDERYSTVEARAQGAADLDAASAAVILEQFLRELE